VLVETTPDVTNVPQTSQNSLQLQQHSITREMGEQHAMTIKALLYLKYPYFNKAQVVTRGGSPNCCCGTPNYFLSK